MSWVKKAGLIAVLALLSSGIIAAAGFDRLRSLVYIGGGGTTGQLIFDTNNGANNGNINSDSSGNVYTTASHATGTGTTFAIKNSNTGQSTTITSGSGNTSPTINLATSDDLVTVINAAERFRVYANGDLKNTGSHATGNGTQLDIVNNSTGQDLNFNAGSGNRTPSISTTTADDLIIATNTVEVARFLNGGGFKDVGGGNATSQAFKVAVFTGSLAASGSTTLTAPSGDILGLMGWNSANFVPFLGVQGAVGGATNGLVWAAGSSNTNVVIQNINSITQTYIVVMFYL